MSARVRGIPGLIRILECMNAFLRNLLARILRYSKVCIDGRLDIPVKKVPTAGGHVTNRGLPKSFEGIPKGLIDGKQGQKGFSPPGISAPTFQTDVDTDIVVVHLTRTTKVKDRSQRSFSFVKANSRKDHKGSFHCKNNSITNIQFPEPVKMVYDQVSATYVFPAHHLRPLPWAHP
ncbi:uncharacterized protein MELLADRAFT_106413 [Melampsora larici-populina 98AG31]|uniref:Uncharacterized protein n=1 Tax=Melampsora larici-populina (strain 98AG31 / pathotype 3-4-7) TaxID=747676 RepID=F4RLA9_MELLP|nr:uncharacterized protein MELLADRAFT_106413 [Melampsora larici-populina 98AG31]EGG06878.1 hypothetical protein MELLADRAFT_106413 [Melampsora larici-populina 98AG31]